MSKNEISEFVGQIKQEELKLKEVEERIESFSAKAREYRNSAQKSEPSPETPAKVAELIRQAIYYKSLAENTMHTERYTQLQKLDMAKETATRLGNPALTVHKEFLVIDESVIASECMFKSVTEFCEKIIPYLLNKKNESLFYLGSTMMRRRIRWWTWMILKQLIPNPDLSKGWVCFAYNGILNAPVIEQQQR
ncbi:MULTISPECIES: hypothetical protein [unclassified Paenibacillus]|uniref:hypothetical protein n=1 Tax=unclassified Paenibacillus TaxID=185978 RepID=UPI00020D708C|nr:MULTISPECIES: hypothetical protein [unclassified Paenibacillus]EGL18143.1 hypothetical protein HMPREF9413_5984 [Paenibacillus sp. HGF7]EPD88100.1 hypothetical protein HMPREF1207_02642 [Paenibacillus sp. HGH0039]